MGIVGQKFGSSIKRIKVTEHDWKVLLLKEIAGFEQVIVIHAEVLSACRNIIGDVFHLLEGQPRCMNRGDASREDLVEELTEQLARFETLVDIAVGEADLETSLNPTQHGFCQGGVELGLHFGANIVLEIGDLGFGGEEVLLGN